MVGDTKESGTFECLKEDCESVGIDPYEVLLPGDSSEEQVLQHIRSFNHVLSFHGILVDRPIPSHLNEKKVLDAICIEKDVKGIHPFNLGCLAVRDREPLFVPCLPKGCLELLHRNGIAIKGKRVAVISFRNDDLGTSVAQLLQREDATVMVVHSRTTCPDEFTREADIVIADVGKPNVVKDSWIKPDAVVLDLGLNFVLDFAHPFPRRRYPGFRSVGDVSDEEEEGRNKIIQCPDYLIPLTTTMLLSNTLISAKRIHNFK